VKLLLVALLLALPALQYSVYSSFVGNPDPEPRFFLPNYIWCSALLYAAVPILAATRAAIRRWVLTLLAGNVALAAFCVWMAVLLAAGYRDTSIAWILLFPVQLLAMGVALSVDWYLGQSGTKRTG